VGGEEVNDDTVDFAEILKRAMSTDSERARKALKTFKFAKMYGAGPNKLGHLEAQRAYAEACEEWEAGQP
jgi:hypothetical protein